MESITSYYTGVNFSREFLEDIDSGKLKISDHKEFLWWIMEDIQERYPYNEFGYIGDGLVYGIIFR